MNLKISILILLIIPLLAYSQETDNLILEDVKFISFSKDKLGDLDSTFERPFYYFKIIFERNNGEQIIMERVSHDFYGFDPKITEVVYLSPQDHLHFNSKSLSNIVVGKDYNISLWKTEEVYFIDDKIYPSDLVKINKDFFKVRVIYKSRKIKLFERKFPPK